MEYREDGIKMKLKVDQIEDVDWQIVLEKVNDKEYPLQELQFQWNDVEIDNESIEPHFIELTKALQTHTTLVKFISNIDLISKNKHLVVLLKALKDNRSIKYVSTSSRSFDLETADAFCQILLNNQTLVSLNIDAYFRRCIDIG